MGGSSSCLGVKLYKFWFSWLTVTAAATLNGSSRSTWWVAADDIYLSCNNSCGISDPADKVQVSNLTSKSWHYLCKGKNFELNIFSRVASKGAGPSAEINGSETFSQIVMIVVMMVCLLFLMVFQSLSSQLYKFSGLLALQTKSYICSAERSLAQMPIIWHQIDSFSKNCCFSISTLWLKVSDPKQRVFVSLCLMASTRNCARFL